MFIRLKPLPPGAYEVRLVLDENVRQTAAFRVMARSLRRENQAVLKSFPRFGLRATNSCA